MKQTPIQTIQKRAIALDALRGLAILGMIFSGMIPYGKLPNGETLPTWMYHAQTPPPTHKFNIDIPGLTWVDLVFPMFLFAMGAAIPLALSRRIDKDWGNTKVLLFILKRGFLLGSFAIFLQHIRPFQLNSSPKSDTWFLCLIGFIILFFMYVRFPKSWSKNLKRYMTIGAWIMAIIFLALLKYPNDKSFALERNDIILVLLTNSAVFGSLVWFFTRKNLLLRLGFLPVLFAMKLAAGTGTSWLTALWTYSPVPWIFKFEYIPYLFLVIPGTIVGDLIIDWHENKDFSSEEEEEKDTTVTDNWDNFYLMIITWSMFAICLILLLGLQTRLILPTTIIVLIFCILIWLLLDKPTNASEQLITTLYRWGVYWLVLGLMFEPFEGGIKKDPPTMSYFFVTAAISIFLLIALTILIDILQQKKWINLLLQFLIDNGQNPMIGYVGVANFIWPILGITGAYQWIAENTKTPSLGIFRALIYTIVLGLLVQLCTKFKIFWRT